jgi:hypothetical protein
MRQKAAHRQCHEQEIFGLRITALILSVASVNGQQLGTVEQARAMLDRAISALKSNEATALSEFNDPNNKQFQERDLYVFCYDMSDGKITAYERCPYFGAPGRPDRKKSIRSRSERAGRKHIHDRLQIPEARYDRGGPKANS